MLKKMKKKSIFETTKFCKFFFMKPKKILKKILISNTNSNFF